MRCRIVKTFALVNGLYLAKDQGNL